ncbi:hypothetical protein LAUMK13_04863 [Mycobacterium innocens]|uniref:Uncharacterized protein n=1 Tax=Mycobacterium innocens TaxID=2341083 RepID=A0A498QHZ2_9MYCO|nr:hypothetical protein LAUMK13_04863 [Mycobacterium innocens]
MQDVHPRSVMRYPMAHPLAAPPAPAGWDGPRWPTRRSMVSRCRKVGRRCQQMVQTPPVPVNWRHPPDRLRPGLRWHRTGRQLRQHQVALTHPGSPPAVGTGPAVSSVGTLAEHRIDIFPTVAAGAAAAATAGAAVAAPASWPPWPPAAPTPPDPPAPAAPRPPLPHNYPHPRRPAPARSRRRHYRSTNAQRAIASAH